MPMLKILFTLAILSLTGPALAGTQTCNAPQYRELDFWLGNWDSYDDDGKGSNVARDRITSVLGGCVILEDYLQNDGYEGQSFNIYDASRQVWNQTWVTNRGELLVLEGHFAHHVLTMLGHNLDKSGKPVWYRATWQRQGKGVRETAYISHDGGKSWQRDFDILFKKHR